MFGANHTDEAWKRFGTADPYFGVYTDDRFRTDRLDSDAKASFFRSGEEHIDFVFHVIREQLCPDFRPVRALDFGCGVGRLTIPLARRCTQVVGLDVSEGMLAEARKNSRERSVSNIEFLGSDDEMSQVRGSFDFVHTHIVMQHIPPKRGMKLTGMLVKLLSNGGIGVLHFTYARRASRLRKMVNWMRRSLPLVNGVVNVIQGRSLREPMMQMNSYDLNQICAMLQDQDCNNVCLRFTGHGGFLGVMFFFVKNEDKIERRS
jgi:ubiquinone/menaquinone biosynthesis C-methylase UbiE